MLFLPLLCSVLAAQGTRMDERVRRAPREGQEAEAQTRSLRRLARPAKKLSLGEVSKEERRRPALRKPGLTPVGVARELPAGVLRSGEWSVTGEGTRVWRLVLQSTGAEALRVRFTDFHVVAGKVWLLGREEAGSGPYTGDGLFGDGAFWSDLSGGDTVTIAYEPDAAHSGEEIPFQVEQVSHRFAEAERKTAAEEEDPGEITVKPLAAAAGCAVDVTCHAAYAEPASAVALMLFESGGRSYQCSGSLINSATDPVLPYFLTANHCISTVEEAKSLVTVFRYQTAMCDGTPPALSGLPRVTGSTLVVGQPMASGDFTLLRLTGFPAVDVKVLGWISEPLETGESVIGISHPRGDFKRIAFGQRTRDLTIRFSDGERMPASAGYQVAWTQGLTQGGSSGSPLLVTRDGKQYVAGTLTAGPNIDDTNATLACRAENLIASYGRFSTAFSHMRSYLTGEAVTATPSGTEARAALTATALTLARGRIYGRTTLRWEANGVTAVQIRVDSPTGVRVTGIVAPSGTLETGNWVTVGTVFYLQDATGGVSSGAERTLATVRIAAP